MYPCCRYKPNPRLARAIDIMFTLHAEHEMNCSTAAARHLASSGVDVYTAIAGAAHVLSWSMPCSEWHVCVPLRSAWTADCPHKTPFSSHAVGLPYLGCLLHRCRESCTGC